MIEDILEILSQSNVFLTGGGGVGKSYTTRAIINHYRKNGKNVVVLGSTGISACGIGGITLHSFFKFGISKNLDELIKLDKKDRKKLNEIGHIIEKTDLIVIDEISMVSGDLLEMINFRLRTNFFSGKILVVGDFYQLPPVNKEQNRLFSSYYAFGSSAWESLDFVCIELTKPKRTKDLEFFKFLSNLRVGICSKESVEFIKSKLVDNIDMDSLAIFGTNSEADRVNQHRLNSIDGELVNLYSIEKIMDSTLSTKQFYDWLENLTALRHLELKIGCRVMFLVNKKGVYYNGEQGFVEGFAKTDDDFISGVFVRKLNGEVIEVERYSYHIIEFKADGDDIKENYRAEFSQFPLRLAYAITIHKSQGMSIDNLTCQIDKIFAPGQLYVALSRATNTQNLKIIYNRNYLDFYLKKIVFRNNVVDDFYSSSKFIKIEEEI